MNFFSLYLKKLRKVNNSVLFKNNSHCENYSCKTFLIIFALFFIFIFIVYFEMKLKVKLKNYSIGKQFIDKCLRNENIYNFSDFYDSPQISVIIPAYNCEKTIYYPIISIQNQNFSKYEIILINDFSTDQTLKTILLWSKHDKRIKIINNKENKGTLYSRCLGTLMSKGKYIFPLDNDDMLFGEDIFDYLYKINIEDKYDIVGFNAVKAKSYFDNIYKMKDISNYKYKDNLIVIQPELSTWLISINGKFITHDVTLWGKIIKSKLYKNGINLLGKNRYSTYMSWAEDTTMNFVIFNIANNFKFILKYGIFHLISKSTASYTQPINNHFFGELFFTEIIFDFSNNNHNKIFALFSAMFILKKFYQKRSLIKRNNIQYLNNIISKILNSKHISIYNKNNLISSFHKFLS